jgi:hypothetical protein
MTNPPGMCFIVGGGPSLKNFDWSLLNNKFVIAINRAYEVLPNAQIVYFTDDNWYREHREQLLKHSGRLIKGSLTLDKHKDDPIEQYLLTGPNGLETTPGKLRHGHNSAYAAINLAGIHLKIKNIYLLGIDMKWKYSENGKLSHWHDGHKRVDPESSYNTFKKWFSTMSGPLKEHDIEVVNLNSPKGTDLTTFPVVPIDRILHK